MKFVGFVAICLLLNACSNAKTEFVEGCVSSGAPENICSCIYDNLEEKHGSEALQNITPYSSHSQSAEIAEDMFKYAQQCLGIIK